MTKHKMTKMHLHWYNQSRKHLRNHHFYLCVSQSFLSIYRKMIFKTIASNEHRESHFYTNVLNCFVCLFHTSFHQWKNIENEQNEQFFEFVLLLLHNKKNVQSVKIWFVIIVIVNAMQKVDQYNECTKTKNHLNPLDEKWNKLK